MFRVLICLVEIHSIKELAILRVQVEVHVKLYPHILLCYCRDNTFILRASHHKCEVAI